MIATSGHALRDPVTAYVEVPNNQWTLLVAPGKGWLPSWRSPMLATVIIISVSFGGLVMATLVSRHLQLWLLKETKVSVWLVWLLLGRLESTLLPVGRVLFLYGTAWAC
jgi:hypothetical protein